MDQDTKATISQIQQTIWKLKEAFSLLNGIDGMDEYANRIDRTIANLEQELEEIWSLERA